MSMKNVLMLSCLIYHIKSIIQQKIIAYVLKNL